MRRIVFALLLLTTPVRGEELQLPLPDGGPSIHHNTVTIDAAQLRGNYGRGFCDAVAIMLRNREHYRALHGFPAETMRQSLDRIAEAWPPRPPAGYNPSNTLVGSTVTLEMAGIDLYVMVNPTPWCGPDQAGGEASGRR